MSLDPPKVLLERSFLRAVADPTDEHHDEAVARYRALVDGFEREELLLVAVGSHLREVEQADDAAAVERLVWFLHRPHRGLFAPVEPLYVGFQHRRAVRRTAVDEHATALTLVMCDRHKVRRIASVSDAFEQYELER